MGEQREPMNAVRFGEALSQEVAELTRSFTRHNRGGMQLEEVSKFLFECLDSMADLGTQYMDLSHEDQQREVCDAVQRVVQGLDLPWLQEPFESMVKMALYTYVVPQLFTVMVESKTRAQDERHHGARRDRDEEAQDTETGDEYGSQSEPRDESQDGESESGGDAQLRQSEQESTRQS